jgi:hypothetical protein
MAGHVPYSDRPLYTTPTESIRQPDPYGRPEPAPRRIAAGRLWTTGIATALVAALAAVVSLLLIRGVLNVPVFAPRGAGAWGDATTGYVALLAALTAVAATGLLHLLLVTVARPRAFFAWIVGLVTAAVALLPFTTGLDLSTRIGSAAVFLVIGVTIDCLLFAIVPGVVAYRGYPDGEYADF